MLCTSLKLNFIRLLLLFFCSQLIANDSLKSIKASKNIGIYYLSDYTDMSETESFTDFSLKLKLALVKKYPNLNFTVFDLTNLLPFEIDENLSSSPDFTITIGQKALLKVLASRSNTPIFSLKTPKITVDRMRKIYADLSIQLSGIYREQPLRNQLLLANAIQPLNKNIYLLFGRMSRYYLNDYKKQIANLDLIINYQVLKNQDSPVSYFNKMNPQSGFLLLFDNPQQFTRQKIELLLPNSFKLDIPMIGNRFLHGSIGALASVYSNDSEIIDQTGEVISQYFKKNKLESPFYLQGFSVFVNQQIAQNFNLTNLNEKQLEKKIKSRINQLN